MSRHSMGKRKAKNGSEEDVFSRFARSITNLPIRKIKRQANKRDRRIGSIHSVMEDEHGIVFRGRIEP